jgi:FkbM family methyltransferase
MNLLQSIVRRAHVPFYAVKLLGETWRLWGFRRWMGFWTSREEDVLLTMSGLKFLVRSSRIETQMTDTFAIMESLHHRLYNRRFFNEEFRIGDYDTVVDIGGYIGSFTVPAAKCAKHGIVYAFEPSPGNFGQLEKNLRLNDVGNAKAFNLGIASSDREITLFLDRRNLASNSLFLRSDQEPAHCVRAAAISLGSLFARHDIRHCDFLKIDCEGAEYEILMTLDRAVLERIGKIACEVHEPAYYGVTDPAHTPAKLVKFLEEKGFAVHRKPVNPYLGMIYALNRDFRKARPA